jgi:membrane protein
MISEKTNGSPGVLASLGIVLAYVGLRTILPSDQNADGAKGTPIAPFRPSDSHAVQQARAIEVGRGRRAASPHEIPWRGWKDVLWRTYTQIQEDRLLAISAGVVFYGLLAIFPAITALVSLYGLFASASKIQEHLAFLSAFMPEAAVSIVDEQISRVVSQGDTKLSLGFLFGLGVALWSANAGMKAMIDALNVAYEEEEKRGFFKLSLVSLLFTICAVGAMLLAIGAIVALPLLFERIGLGALSSGTIGYGRWPALWLGLMFALAILYRYGPSRQQPKWTWVNVGSIVASILWIAGSAAFSYYLEKYANYDATYGSLGAGIGMMMWMWMTTIVILLGAELNSEIEHQTAVDTTDGVPKPLGLRGATMADTVGAAQAQ